MKLASNLLPLIRSDLPPPSFLTISAANYHADRQAVSQGALQDILMSPAHFATGWEAMATSFEDNTAYQRTGTIIHSGLFEPEEFKKYAVMPYFGNANANATKEKKAEWLLENEGCIVITERELEDAKPVIDAIGEHPDWQAVTRDMMFEQTVYWHGPHGVRSRARIDGVSWRSRKLLDLKTTADSRAKAFSKHIEDFGYHFQAAHYLEAASATAAVEAVPGRPIPEGKGFFYEDYVFCVAERAKPYGVNFYLLDKRALARARVLRERAYEILAKCIETNNWPGYEPGIKTVDLPPWAYQSLEAF